MRQALTPWSMYSALMVAALLTGCSARYDRARPAQWPATISHSSRQPIPVFDCTMPDGSSLITTQSACDDAK
jgi:hypothetical protein